VFTRHSQILAFMLHRRDAKESSRLRWLGIRYPRRPLLGTPQSRHLCLEVMEQTGKRHHFVVVGYVVMSEHVHLLFREPERGKPSLVLLRSKQTFARRLPRNLRGRINSKIRKTARSEHALRQLAPRRYEGNPPDVTLSG